MASKSSNTAPAETVTTVVVPDRLDDATMGAVIDFDSALAVLRSAGVTVEDGSAYGDGVETTDKSTLTNIPLLFVDWTFKDGDKGTYCVVRGVAKPKTGAPFKFVFADGSSSGVCHQLAEITERRTMEGNAHPTKGLLFEKGLRRSDYKTKDGIDGTTFYIAL